MQIITTKVITQKDLNENVLDWLRSINVPIASSCNGEGICQKCKINGDILACTTKLSDLLDQKNQTITINISYL